MLDILFWVVCGGLVGWIASMLVADAPGSSIITAGIVGAILGGLLSRATGSVSGGLDIFATISAIFGSVLLVLILLFLTRSATAHNK